MSVPIDLRSDTVTRPTPGMRQAMAQAEVGDDVFGEDPTVNRLQARVAELLGREAALFVPTGSMGNQTAVAVHTRPGQEVVGDADCHIFNYELATFAQFAGVMSRLVPTARGFLDVPDLERAINLDPTHRAVTGLVVLENTHNMKGGGVYPPEQLRAVVAYAHERGIPVHLDGARIFNAATALGRPVAEVVDRVDSVMFCFSKGLGAPVGSILVGSRAFIAEAHRVRKRLGGGMRQAGVLAAACLYALDHHLARLAEDHAHAKQLEATLRGLGLAVDPVETNIVIFTLSRPEAPQVVARLKERGVLALPVAPDRVRLVTHLDVNAEQIARACEALKAVLDAGSGQTRPR